MEKNVLIVLAVFGVALAAVLLDGTITGKAISPYTCSDSDGGRNPEVQGTVENELGSYADACRDARTLHENYCKGNVQRMETVPCRFGCQDGACVSD